MKYNFFKKFLLSLLNSEKFFDTIISVIENMTDYIEKR